MTAHTLERYSESYHSRRVKRERREALRAAAFWILGSLLLAASVLDLQ